MLKRNVVVVALCALALSSCSLSNRETGLTSESGASEVEQSLAPSSTPTATQVGGMVLGPVTVSGDIGIEPKVVVDVQAQPVTDLLQKDLAVGSGPAVVSTSTVTAHYVGYGAASGLKFDGSWESGSPATFPLTNVIVGWQEGLLGMQAGGRRILVIPGAMAYGSSPPSSAIAPNEALIFVVDLVSFQ